ncbi:hypothetical protein B0H11DRAFT_1929467 [Mycena galericulata]|nr:hypothetical protein B0H11DRAFT_1929467 [Mycena galericulata]
MDAENTNPNIVLCVPGYKCDVSTLGARPSRCGRGGDAALPRRLTRRSKIGDRRSHVLETVGTPYQAGHVAPLYGCKMANKVSKFLEFNVGRGGHAAGRGDDAADAAKCLVNSPRPSFWTRRYRRMTRRYAALQSEGRGVSDT